MIRAALAKEEAAKSKAQKGALGFPSSDPLSRLLSFRTGYGLTAFFPVLHQ